MKYPSLPLPGNIPEEGFLCHFLLLQTRSLLNVYDGTDPCALTQSLFYPFLSEDELDILARYISDTSSSILYETIKLYPEKVQRKIESMYKKVNRAFIDYYHY